MDWQPKGTIDLSFTMDSPANSNAIELTTEILGIPRHKECVEGIISVKIIVTYDTVTYITTKTKISGIDMDTQKISLGTVGVTNFNIKIFLYDTYISVYCNDLCVYAYSLYSANYVNSPSLRLIKTGSYAVNNVCLREIPDAREAIYVDYEATTESAIQSIIQQRPIEINPEINREINFTYDATKDNIQGHNINSYEDIEQDNLQMSSDGIVYYENVGVAINVDTAKQVGFITRMYRLSELSSGAIEAAEKYQKSALQRRHSSSIVLKRIDPRIEVRDVIVVDVIVTGTLRHITDEVIVENVSISLEEGSYSTNISGRKNG